jgi:hypothetical protein
MHERSSASALMHNFRKDFGKANSHFRTCNSSRELRFSWTKKMERKKP